MTVLDATGDEVARYDYYSGAADVVSELTALFGRAPTTSHFAGGGDVLPATDYNWDGFLLADTDGPGSAPYTPDYWVRVESAVVDGIRVQAEGGIVVGSSTAAVESAYPDYVSKYRAPETDIENSYVRINPVPIPSMPSLPDESLDFATSVYSKDASTVVTWILAPSPSFGA